MDCTIYRQLIGSLLYLTHSRLDICYCVNDVSGYMQKPHDIPWKEAKRILQYIQGTRTYDIHYAANSELELVGYIDSVWRFAITPKLANVGEHFEAQHKALSPRVVVKPLVLYSQRCGSYTMWRYPILQHPASGVA